MDLSDMREEYAVGQFDETDSSSQPVEQFTRWFDDALRAKLFEPNAMTLATAAGGRPSTRIVLMKSFDSQGIIFYTNYLSRKGRELAENPQAALQFFWPKLERVVRIEGTVTKVSDTESDRYFNQRPLDSRLGAWASPQSQVISSRLVLVKKAAQASAKFGFHPPRPEWWGGFRLVPDYWEFWQGRTSRLHDRICYRLDAGNWHRERLAP